ncbi:fumarylacetoacetate hydrolase family protein [Phaeobacter inhibens]|uniref:fumarylacetoacetate hydrolase family protein n=1 Tax=Phaeobacter inhibens TaxID=221822 RepID=UPI000C9A2A3C|nr:fumarylacetoacetate hydrolase family protein [Phaeobacter inhibens]AUQ57358.1 ureidoglycolate lyase [Phaeobacter inhibens]AUQ61415.1 ureidoglycolate lyase [Phaeobacter inhibens]AUQ69347.1 ureidoglycolate lyase [Phaeobacter inhibens]AUQ81382.1 ureidoglycolate lyase [Phaeobacter inhibens]AUQ89045.1 ureidoglycolate lyase [Phaeobacter inhibens]
MKLLRYHSASGIRPGLKADDGTLRDLGDYIADLTGAELGRDTQAKLASLPLADLPIIRGEPRLAPCVGNVGKFLCIGLNYRDHAEEAGLAIPKHPILFLKANSAISGPNDPVVLPRGAEKADWEVELGVVIGKTAKYVGAEDALDHVAGYCVVNDVSERSFQMDLSGQWTKGKSCDSFGPIGPWLVTPDEVPDPQQLALYCDVNGKRMQQGHSGTMIFSVAEIISHLSQLMTLHPGDLIATGTPPGVGMGQKPVPVYLQAGDTLRLGIDGLGEQRQHIIEDS